MSKELFETLLTNLVNGVNGIKAAAIVDKEGLIISSKLSEHSGSDDIIGSVTAVFENLISRVKTDFGSAEDFVNTMSVDKNKFVFAGAGPEATLTVLADMDAEDNRLKVFCEFFAEKIRFIIEGETVDLGVPPILEVLANMKSGKLPKGEYSMKIIVLGDPQVGKTSIIRRFVDNKFAESYISTIGVDLSRKQINLSKECIISMTIWDIGGQIQTMAPYRKRFYQGANFAFLEFDISRKNTFTNLDNWIQDLKKSVDKMVPMVLIANKMDIPNQETTIDEIKAKAEALNCPFILCSAKTGSNVNEAFRYAGYKFCENV